LHDDQVFDANAVGAFEIETRLAGENHARLKGHGVARGDACGAFMDGEERTHAVPGAMIIGETNLPERLAGEDIDLRSGGAFWKAGPGNGDHALENAGEMILLLRGDRARRH